MKLRNLYKRTTENVESISKNRGKFERQQLRVLRRFHKNLIGC